MKSKSIKELMKMVKVLHKMYLNEAGETNEFSSLEEETRHLLAYTLKKEYLSAYKQRDEYAGFNIYNPEMELVNVISVNCEDVNTRLLNLAYTGLIAIPQYFGKYKIHCVQTGEIWYKNTASEVAEILNETIYAVINNNELYTIEVENLITEFTTTILISDCIGNFTAYGDHSVDMIYLKSDFTEGSIFYNLDSEELEIEDEK